MEGGFPMLNYLLQSTLRNLCCSSDASSTSKWVYAVFWRILPRNYPPPKWDYGGTALDRSKGNKRNWILVWEDGFCDFYECERIRSGYVKGRFGPQVFFKMSHEVYSFGEGLVGKVAEDNSHKWVYRPTASENDPCFISSWNVSIEPPKAWEFQFSSGIQTIAIISVREGIIQLGSLHKISEDVNLVINVQRKFSYLQSIPGIFTMQRPYFPFQNPSFLKPNIQIIDSKESAVSADEKNQMTGFKRSFDESLDDCPIPTKSINLGWNSPQNGIPGPPIWSIPPLIPSMSCSFGAFLSKLPSGIQYFSNPDTALVNSNQNRCTRQQVKASGCSELAQGEPEDTEIESSWQVHSTKRGKPNLASPIFDLKVEVCKLGPLTEGQGALNLN